MAKIQVDILELTLGERDFTVYAAGLKRSEAWRTKFQSEIGGLLEGLREQSGVLGDLDLAHLSSLAQMDAMSLIPALFNLFSRLNLSLNGLPELLAAYSPVLEQNLEYITENATTKQALAALIEMAKLEYPFGLLLNQPQPSPNGLQAATILTN